MLLFSIAIAAATLQTPPAQVAVEAREAPTGRPSRRERIINARLVWHVRFDNCVRRNALDIADQPQDLNTLAKAAVVLCEQEERDLWNAAFRQCRALGRGGGDSDREGACADRLMDRWLVEAEREALRCVAAKRFRPEAVPQICQIDQSEATEPQ
jgi:hypothetical protein